MPEAGKTTVLKSLIYATMRIIIKCWLRCVHRLKITGLENVPESFDKLIIICNHASLIDGLIIWAYLKVPLKIIVNRGRAREWLLRPFMQNDFTVPIDAMNPYALKEVIEEVNGGTALLIFPEGRITRTGNLMKIYEGTGFVAYKTGAVILPVYLENTFSTIYSRKNKGKKFFAPVTMNIGALQSPISVGHLPPKVRKKEAAAMIYKILCNLRYTVFNRPSTLGREFVRLCKEHGSAQAYKDATGSQVTYKKALTGAFVLGRYLARFPDKNIGILLPNLTATALIFMGIGLFRKTAVFLNFSSGPAALSHAMDLADLRVIVTSRQFLERVKISPDLFQGREVVYIDDLKNTLGLKEKLAGLIRSVFPHSYCKMAAGDEKETAVILFTSGSEGMPKGVCLSHENIISNIHQALSGIDVRENDYFLNALPIFHSFGLTIGTILPLFAGARSFLYVSPLHYRIIPEVVYDEGCTILMGTNTFLKGYARKAHPYDFQTMRYVYCGAEALSDTVFETYAKIYGVRVMSATALRNARLSSP